MLNLPEIVTKILKNEIDSIDLSNQSLPDYTQKPELKESIVIKKSLYLSAPDMAFLSHNKLVISYGKMLYIWDTVELALVDVVNAKNKIYKLLKLPDGSLLTHHDDNSLKRWYFDKKILGERILTLDDKIYAMHLMPNNLLVLGLEQGIIQFRHLDTMKLVSVLQANKSRINLLVYQDKSHLISIDSDNYLTRWYLDAMALDGMTKLEFPVYALSVYCSGLIILGSTEGKIYTYDYISRSFRNSFKISEGGIDLIKSLPDASIIAADTNGVCIIDLMMNSIIQSILLPYNTEQNYIRRIEILPDGRLIICVELEFNGGYKIILLKFPKRQLRYEDLDKIVQTLEKNQSVVSINLNNVELKDWQFVNILSELGRTRNDLKIIGLNSQ